MRTTIFTLLCIGWLGAGPLVGQAAEPAGRRDAELERLRQENEKLRERVKELEAEKAARRDAAARPQVAALQAVVAGQRKELQLAALSAVQHLTVRRAAAVQLATFEVLRGGGAGRVVLSKRVFARDTSPLLSGDLRAALRGFDAARSSVANAASRAAARTVLDRALDALDRTRDALWDRVEHPGRRDEEDPEPQATQTFIWRAGIGEPTGEDAPPAFLGGAVGEALGQLDAARHELGRARDEHAAFRALDEAVRALMRAHRGLTPQSARSRR